MSESKEVMGEEAQEIRKEAERERVDQRRRHRALGAVLNFYLWLPLPLKIIFLIFGLLYSPPMVQNLFACIGAPKSGRLRVISGPDYLFFYLAGMWGLILCGIFKLFGEQMGQSVHEVLCWLYLALTLLTYITIGLDFKGGSWIGIIILGIAGFAFIGWIGAQQEIPVIQLIWPVFAWFSLHTFPTEWIFALSLLSLLVFVVVWIRMNLVEVLKIEGNYVQVWTLASKSPKDTRASFSIVPDYDDINEALLGFSCRLNMRSKSSRIESHEFPNMPGGPVVEHIATHLLNAQEVRFASEDDVFHSGDGGDQDDD